MAISTRISVNHQISDNLITLNTSKGKYSYKFHFYKNKNLTKWKALI